MYRDTYTHQLIEQDEELFTVVALGEWTNTVLSIAHDVPFHGIDHAVDQLRFYAWDHPGAPVSCDIYVLPNNTVPYTCTRIHQTMMRYARYVDRYDAQPDGAASPLDAVVEHSYA